MKAHNGGVGMSDDKVKTSVLTAQLACQVLNISQIY